MLGMKTLPPFVYRFPAGYLPMDCPNCGRRRLEYGVNLDGNVVYVECEKCHANSEGDPYGFSPEQRDDGFEVTPVKLPVGYLSVLALRVSDDPWWNRPQTVRGKAMRVAYDNLMAMLKEARRR